MSFARLVSRCALATVAVSACSTAVPSRGIQIESSYSPWWRDGGVCYEVFVRSFYDSDGDGVGDLRGLTARLDYINDGNPNSTKSLGANCVWLMPIAKAKSYHGYDVIDYYHVDPHYGTDDDFRGFVREAHRRGIHVIVDFVPNHSSSDHPFFQAALKDPASKYRKWYRFSETDPKQPGPWGQVAWHKSPLRDEYYYGVFWHEMPDLNYQNPEVMQEMMNVTRHWVMSMGVDGFRFDAIPYLIEQGDTLTHSSGTHAVLRHFAFAIRASSSSQAFTVGEESDMAALPSYYPDQLDSYFEFGVAAGTMESARTGTAAAFVREVSRANTLPEGRWAPFLTNHDQPRVMTVLGDAAKARVAASAMLLLPGTPFVYYGEEIGMIGDKPDETIRTPMQWTSGMNGGFTTGKPWEALQADWVSKNVAAQESDERSLLNHYRRLIHFRNAHLALSRGTLLIGSTNDSRTSAFIRSAGPETALIVLNFGDAAVRNLIASMNATFVTDQMRPLYADPADGCGSTRSGNDTKSVSLDSIAAHGLCVFELSTK